ncbi:type VI secretion system baseplate subunit TssG [Chromobacterium sp. ATCC 53434]|uniref:type VI secretion system baseplate subunit TssG n=1 Tax=Chromobacterium sp. (strain ATCC 53434 / SC 14030) TaxID=2059672 RepID=UPI000C766531|nr:type VI secretion system baseplate subunit TssG [Chromobacterium sp. ATCC 53434]AUH51023.1 type VI secretion system baseplate subunit TssG [Chromobacterium sp. ATCC 53434]
MKRQQWTRELHPHRSFFELMRRVETLQRQRTEATTERGRDRRPDWLTLEQTADMRFASAEVSSVRIAAEEEGASPQVGVACRHFGLFAPYGPLPLYITEHALHERRLEHNPAFERFVNLACGDLAWMHYRARSVMHPALGYERGRHPFAERISALAYAGPDADGKIDRHAAACRHSHPGAYLAPRRSLADLQKIMAGYFDVPVQLLPRRGRWIALSAASGPCRLGRWRLGSRIWDVQHTLEILIGPIDAADFPHWQRRADAVLAIFAVAADFSDGRIGPLIKVQVRTRPELAGRVGRMRLGVDAWSRPGAALRTIIVYDSFRDPQ